MYTFEHNVTFYRCTIWFRRRSSLEELLPLCRK